MEQNDNILTVTQLTNLIKSMLEGTFPNVQLKGEISNLKINQSSGHFYFVLKDNESQISAVMFRGRAAYLDFTPQDGMLVNVRGGISVYGPRGNYQIIISSMHKAGEGEIMQMLEERKRRMAAEGLFDSARKRPLPYFPKTIGVVTSPTGAAIKDIIQIIRRRNDKVSVIVFPSLVQGDGAADSITSMIKAANRWKLCDVLIVGRGGGSLEDLLPFSSDNVVNAIVDSEIPVISAVGHEIDWALSDYAADVRASTPSAAAELAVPLRQEIDNVIQVSKNDMYQSISTRLGNLKLMLKTFTPENMELQFRRIESPLVNRFEAAKEALTQNFERLIEERRNRIKQCTQTLENCNPQTILDRGYSMVTDGATGKVIRNSSELKPGSKIVIKPSSGTILATVDEI